MFADYYVISGSGFQMMGGGGRREGAPSTDVNEAQQMQQQRQQRIQQMIEALKAGTKLKLKKQTLNAAKVGMIQRDGKPVVFFMFPRDPKITAEDKDAEFECKLGPMEVKVKFHPKEMGYGGKLEL